MPHQQEQQAVKSLIDRSESEEHVVHNTDLFLYCCKVTNRIRIRGHSGAAFKSPSPSPTPCSGRAAPTSTSSSSAAGSNIDVTVTGIASIQQGYQRDQQQQQDAAVLARSAV